MISEKELNSYRLTSMEEPTDEMLTQIMHEAAEIYNRENGEKSKEPPINSSPQHISIIVFPIFVFLVY